MNQSLIVKPSIDAARSALDDARQSLNERTYRDSKDLDGSDTDVQYATEALFRAVAAVANAVERLAELVVD